jgi:SNF2 family DNA or RNA helicase
MFWCSYMKTRDTLRATRRPVLDGLERSVNYDWTAFGTLDPKNQGVVNIATHLLSQDPDSTVLVFVQYHSELDILAESLCALLQDANDVVQYNGVLQQSQKNARLALLKSGKVKVFIATLASAGTGLNLQDVSYRVLFTTPSYVPADELQGIGRVVRHGQEQPVVIYRFLLEPCDSRVMAIQFAKMRVMEETHGGYSSAGLAHQMLGDAANDEPMLQVLTDQYAAGPSGSGAEPNGEAEFESEEDEPPNKRARDTKGKGKAKR